MGFRRDGKAAHEESRQWQAWLGAHAELLRDCGLPPGVLQSRADWEYLLRFGYHCGGAYPGIDFRLEDLSPSQAAALRALLAQALSAEEKRRGGAAWHFVCPPETPG